MPPPPSPLKRRGSRRAWWWRDLACQGRCDRQGGLDARRPRDRRWRRLGDTQQSYNGSIRSRRVRQLMVELGVQEVDDGEQVGDEERNHLPDLPVDARWQRVTQNVQKPRLQPPLGRRWRVDRATSRKIDQVVRPHIGLDEDGYQLVAGSGVADGTHKSKQPSPSASRSLGDRSDDRDSRGGRPGCSARPSAHRQIAAGSCVKRRRR